MRPEYWIGILAVVGSVLGLIPGQIFQGIDLLTPAIGTVLGAAAGTAVFSAKREKSGSEKDQD